MQDGRKIAKAARHRAARRRARFRWLSFGAGILLTLLIGTTVLLNGRGDTTFSSQNITPAPEVTVQTTATATVRPTSTPVPTTQPTIAPVITEEPTFEPLAASPEVTPVPVSVKLNVKDKVEMEKGDTGTIRATLDPPDPTAVLTWKSSNEKVVKVNQDGDVKAVGSGTAEVGLWINDDDEAKAVVKIKVESSTKYVWIPKTGKKYHSNPDCSNMKNPKKVTLSYAKSHGYGKCSKCW